MARLGNHNSSRWLERLFCFVLNESGLGFSEEECLGKLEEIALKAYSDGVINDRQLEVLKHRYPFSNNEELSQRAMARILGVSAYRVVNTSKNLPDVNSVSLLQRKEANFWRVKNPSQTPRTSVRGFFHMERKTYKDLRKYISDTFPKGF